MFMKFFLKAFLLALPCFVRAATLNQILPDPYPQVYENAIVLPFNSHGWYANAVVLEKLIKANDVKNIIEVGSWLGTSTRHMAKLIPDDGKVFAVDHWQGSVEHFQMHQVKDWIPTLYNQFLSNVIHEKLTNKIIPVRMDSLTAAAKLKKLDIQIDLIYIDAAHDFESVYKDLVAWYPYVWRGIFCGDDWHIGDVQNAVKRFASEHDLKVFSEGNFWMLLD